jgi:hypothetical protein
MTPPSIPFSCHQPGPLPFPLAITPYYYIEHTLFVLNYTVYNFLILNLEELSKYRKKQQTQLAAKISFKYLRILNESQQKTSPDLDQDPEGFQYPRF